MNTDKKTTLAEAITDRLCWAMDIQLLETRHGGFGEDAETYTNEAQTIYDILLDELGEVL
ncbi:hypothetical protein BGO17_00700 [Candidatus Saccharibacteria bacterium 49-20]|nr:hypothetical protein [Candidatus Saccharibacteria bacterium]OJU87503.1 MAG: hypothetical protein BGO17_00700 [Candidatus Saccharibacteria bacterium 49-20]OJU97100.1 MAG: hypothetical protein BGO18_02895 [Candidatus Saccharibacteria bacterium 47-87]